MQYQAQFLEMLQGNLPENNLLVLELALPSFQWDAQLTLKWMLEQRVALANTQQELEYFPIGELILHFSQEELTDSRPEHYGYSYGYEIMYELLKEEKSIFKGCGQVLEEDVAKYNFHVEPYKTAILQTIDLVLPILIQEIYPTP